MSGVEIKPETVGAIAARMAELNEEINVRMNQLIDQLSSLENSWRGPASDSFQAARADWEAKARQHSRLLAGIAQGLDTARMAFAANEAIGASNIRATDPYVEA